MANVEATWSVDLYVYCPKCEDGFDLNSDGSFTDGTHGYALQTTADADAECPECGHKFKVDLVW
ncbi:hypothetical protein B7R74_02730 [Yersinia pseudotuberculosis]|uniref:Uncharacterized protein n=1 Tax=Yersinia pseudotuberculosis TaxID=633 RepID=A0A380Q9Q8_YERPU|nr:hypothetical protein [Yersinia pseudotuberculosis]PSH23569.1 hypothetical protein B7R74_02730 [Yersinia pseudotuberculosis]SUP83816.1 Uncharacterised protein [Yersinia pseudotuberculosis]